MSSLPKFNKVNIEIGNICNLQCSFCPEVERTKGFMSVGDFRKIIDEVAPLADQVCFHLMGDPLLHPELGQLVSLCREREVPIFFVTNGLLLRENLSELLLDPSFRQVNFSLHSFFDNFPEKSPDEYLDRIFRFTERAFIERPDLYINYRLWNLSDPRSTDAKHQQMLERIEERFCVAISRTPQVALHKGRRLKNRLYLHFDTEFIWPSLSLPPLGESGFCYGLSSHIGILVDGTVVPCCLDKEGVIALGNIHQTPLKAILAGEKAQRILNGFREGKLKEPLCQRCQYIERFKKNALPAAV